MELKKILVADEFDERQVERLRASDLVVDQDYDVCPQRLVSIIENYDAIIVRSRTKVTSEVLTAGKKLKLVARAGVGVDNVDVPTATKLGIQVINAPDANTTSACELTCAHILAISRNVYPSAKCLKDGIWSRKEFMGNELSGKTLGVIGLGRIGLAVAKRLQAFDMKVIGYDPIASAEQVAEKGIEFVSLEDLWPRSDYITLHVPLLPQTKHLINAETLSKCKDGVYIINVARGGIVAEDDLLEALVSRKVQAAALDVFEQEPPTNEDLLRCPHLLATPHLGASTFDAQVKVGIQIVDQILDLRQGKPVPGSVNGNKL